MHKQIIEEAIREVVNQCTPQALARIHESIERQTLLPIAMVSAMLNIAPKRIRKMFEAEIITITPRNQRIPLSSIQPVLDAIRNQDPTTKEP